jgi:hypothetical protein
MKPFLISMLAIFIAFLELSAQEKYDSISTRQSKDRIISLYESAMEGTHHLYNGSEYFDYEPIGDEHPYFLTEEWSYSDLKYDGDWFRNVPLLLNIDKNKLIASYHYNGNLMQLVESRVDEFILQGHRFVNIKNTTDTTTLRTGYYEVLYDGATPVLARRSKELIEKLEGTEVYRKFAESSQTFIVVNGQYIRVRNRSDVIAALSSKKKELKEYIRIKRLFINEKENSIIQTVQQFDRINGK